MTITVHKNSEEKDDTHVIVTGSFEGDIVCNTCVIELNGSVQGSIDAVGLHVAGIVNGSVTANIITLENTSVFNATYECLHLRDGRTIK